MKSLKGTLIWNDLYISQEYLIICDVKLSLVTNSLKGGI